MNKESIVYFVENASFAEFYRNYINKLDNSISMNIFYSFSAYFHDFIRKYGQTSFVRIGFSFADFPTCLSLIDTVNARKHIYFNFICNQGIDGLAIKFVPINSESYLMEPFDAYDDRREIFRKYIRGIDIQYDAEGTCQTILETANTLNLFKNIYVAERDVNFDEYIDKFIGKIRDYFKVPYFNIAIWEKTKIHRMVLEKQSSQDALLKTELDTPLREWPRYIEVKDINEIKDKKLRVELKSRNIKKRVLIPVDTMHAEGYLYFFSKLEKIGFIESELVESIQKRISSIIDNTLFFRNCLVSKQYSDAFFHNINDTIMIVDKDRKIVDINESVEILTGWKRDQAVGNFCCSIYRSCDFHRTPLCNSSKCPMLVPLYDKKNTSMSRVLTVDKYGSQKVVKSDYLFEKNAMGDTTYGVAIVRDLTERVHLEKKLRHFEHLASLGVFAAEVTHAIRNPITGISSNAQFLCEECHLSENHREIVQDILQGASLVEKTVKKFLSIAIPQEPNMSYEDINDIVEETVAILRKKIHCHNICLNKSLAELLPSIFVDRELIQQTLMNIIMNSIEAVKHDGVITITTELVNSDNSNAQAMDGHVQLTITDNGTGISDDNLEKIFDPFFTTKSKGSGLGLYSAYKTLREHNASIQVQSKVGVGTKTLIRFTREA